MALKEIYVPHLNTTVKMGRSRPDTVAIMQMPKLSDFRLALPEAPPMVDYTAPAMPSLRRIFKNDILGDCVIAMAWHWLGAITGGAGALYVPTDQQVIADYSAIGGYVPGHPNTDNGCDELTAVQYYMKHGFASGDKILGYLSLDATNQQQLMEAIYLFEGIWYGAELPNPWITPFPANDGFVWDVAGGINYANGHAFPGLGYDSRGVKICSWALLGTLTWAANAAYMVPSANGNAFVPVTQSMINKASGKAPNNFDWSAISSFFNAMGGNLPGPNPVFPTSNVFVQDPDSRTVYVPAAWNLKVLHLPNIDQVILYWAKKQIQIPQKPKWTLVTY